MLVERYVLVVDDDRDALRLLTELLQNNGHAVLTATNGPDTIEIVKDHAEFIDTIVLDLMIPGDLDGYGVCEWLKHASEAISEIPVIVLSARSSPKDMVRSFTSGAFQHITKPYDVHYLLAVIQSMVRMKRLQDSARETADKFAAIFDNSPVGLMVVSPDYEILEMNRTLRERYAGVEPGKGAKFYEVFYNPPLDAPQPGSPVSEALTYGNIHRRTLETRENDKPIWWDMSAAPLCDKHGKITGAVLILNDVTHEREIEKQLVEEVQRTHKAKERARKALMHQDEIAANLMQTQRELRQKQAQLEDAYTRLEDANRKLEILSITDELTGLFNRRQFDTAFALETRRATRYKHNLSVFMIDIDHFKEVNDTHGHQVGDTVLRALGSILRDQFRETDLIARYGGEEFAVVLPETPPDIALDIAERLRVKVADYVFRHSDLSLRITISIGITTGTGSLDAEALLSKADAALYEAKHAGRNRVHQAEPDQA